MRVDVDGNPINDEIDSIYCFEDVEITNEGVETDLCVMMYGDDFYFNKQQVEKLIKGLQLALDNGFCGEK